MQANIIFPYAISFLFFTFIDSIQVCTPVIFMWFAQQTRLHSDLKYKAGFLCDWSILWWNFIGWCVILISLIGYKTLNEDKRLFKVRSIEVSNVNVSLSSPSSTLTSVSSFSKTNSLEQLMLFWNILLLLTIPSIR